MIYNILGRRCCEQTVGAGRFANGPPKTLRGNPQRKKRSRSARRRRCGKRERRRDRAERRERTNAVSPATAYDFSRSSLARATKQSPRPSYRYREHRGRDYPACENRLRLLSRPGKIDCYDIIILYYHNVLPVGVQYYTAGGVLKVLLRWVWICKQSYGDSIFFYFFIFFLLVPNTVEHIF